MKQQFIQNTQFDRKMRFKEQQQSIGIYTIGQGDTVADSGSES
jgi:hypothetical protein